MSSPKSPSHWPLSIVSSATSLINMLLPILLVRILPQESVGDYKIFFLYLSLAPAFAFIAGLVSNVPYWSGQKENSTDALKASFQLVLASAAIFTFIAVCLNSKISHAFGWSLGQANLFAFAIFGTVAHQFIEDCLISKGKIWTSSLFSGIFEIIKGSSLVFSAWYWRDTTSVFAAFALVMALKVLVAIIIGIDNHLLSWAVNWRNIYSVAKRASPISLAALFSIFIDRADQFVLSNSLSSADFATYSLGCLIVPPLLSLESSIMRVSIPQIAAAFSHNNFERAARLHRYSIEQLALLIIPASIGLIVFADPIIALLFTEKYQQASGYLRVFSFSYMILIVPFDACARAIGNTAWIFKSFIFFSILCLIFACIGAWEFGAYGALIATILAKSLMRLWGLRFTKITLNCKYKDLLPITSLLKELFLLALLSLVCIALRMFFISPLSWLIICGTAFAAVYLPMALLLRNRAALKFAAEPKILMLVQSLQIGGLEKMVISLTTQLAKNPNLQVQIVAYDQPNLPRSALLSDLALKNNLKLTELEKRKGFSFHTILALSRIIFNEQINIVHTHNIGPLVYAGIIRVITLGKFRIIHSNHSFTELEHFPRYRLYEKIISRLCARIIAVSNEIFGIYLELGVNAKKLFIISNGIEVGEHKIYSREEKIIERRSLIEKSKLIQLNKFIGHKWIIVVARLHPLKGQDISIEIWNHLSGIIRSQICLIFVGPDNDPNFADKIKTLAAQAKASEQIVFVGPTNNPQEWYEVADIYLSSSRLEGMPLAPVEALISGLPLALSNIEGHRFLANHAKLVAIDNYAQAADDLSSLISSPNNHSESEIQVNSMGWAKQQFSIEAMAEHYLKHYREILG